MKNFGMCLLAAVLVASACSCTNDETDTEFDTLTPNEEQTQQLGEEAPEPMQ